MCQWRGTPPPRPHRSSQTALCPAEPAPRSGALAGPGPLPARGEPSPRGGCSQCRLPGDPAPPLPQRPEQAGEATASAPGSRRGSLRGSSGTTLGNDAPQEAGKGDFLGKPGGPFRRWGHPRISIRIQQGGARGMDWDTTSDDLVLRGGGGVQWGPGLNSRGRRRPAARPSSGSAQSHPETDSTEFRGCLRHRSHPRPPQGRPGWAGLWLGPAGRHPTVTGSLSTRSVRPSVLQGQPPPRCPAGLSALPPQEIDRLAGDARPLLAGLRPLPRSGYAGRGLQAASSRFRAAARLGCRPVGEAEAHRALPIAPALPLRVRGGGGGGAAETEPSLPRRGAPHPTPPPAALPGPNTPRARA